MLAVASHPCPTRLSRTRRAWMRPSFLCSVICASLMILAAYPGLAGSQTVSEPALEKKTRPATNRPVNSAEREPVEQTIVREGIAIDFSMDPVRVKHNASRRLQEGDDVAVRFAIRDTATDTPLAGVYPADLMALRAEGEKVVAHRCTDKLSTFLSGSIFSAAELDLNVYYVLALNNDASITVVDPLFGFGGTKLLAMVSLESPGVISFLHHRPYHQVLHLDGVPSDRWCTARIRRWSL